jgi:hypothetical protein
MRSQQPTAAGIRVNPNECATRVRSSGVQPKASAESQLSGVPTLLNKKLSLRLCAISSAVFLLGASAAQAASGSVYNLRGVANNAELSDRAALIIAGNPPDSPTARIDPNLSTSPWAGVVSINIRYSGSSYICSGAMISNVHVLTAGHCVDTTDFGDVIDITKAGNDVRVVFNNQVAVGAPNTITLATATQVQMHPDYAGFGICAAAVADPSAFCVNDDLAILTLNPSQVPTWATPYALTTLNGNAAQTMVGYGTSGTGTTGGTVSPSFFIKRTGGNYSDVYDLNDEQNFSGVKEVWQSDFDGNGEDTHCTLFGVCSPVLANNVETSLAGGDSGGPSFQRLGSGAWAIVGNNTYGTRFFAEQTSSTFGTGSGGMVVAAYYDWIETATGGAAVIAVPEPATYGLMLAGLLGVAAAARRRKSA